MPDPKVKLFACSAVLLTVLEKVIVFDVVVSVLVTGEVPAIVTAPV